jgi:hypothetical protein
LVSSQIVAAAISLALFGCTSRKLPAGDPASLKPDAGEPTRMPKADAAPTDTSTSDTAMPDTATPDAALPDAGTPDSGALDTGTPDVGALPDPTIMLVGMQLENDYCGLKADGRLRCWTDTDYFTQYLAPLVAKAPPGLVQIAVSDTSNSDPLFCGIDAGGHGTCWGAFTNMDMGDGLASLVLSRYGTCALRTDGTVNCASPIQRLPPGHRYVQIAVAADFVIGLDDAGTPVYSQPSVVAGAGVYRQVATVGGEGAALRDDGALVLMTSQQPTVMAGAFVALTFDQRRLCGLDGAGQITCFALPFDSTPPLSPPAGPFTRIASSPKAMCGLRPSGRTTCWGDVAIAVPDGW